MNLSKGIKITRALNAVAAGTTSQNGSILDMSGFDGVMFVAAFGTLTATQVTSLKAQQGALVGGGDMADLAGSAVGPLADADSNKCLVLDVYRPLEQYVRPVVVRGTANAVIDGVIAIQYSSRVKPTVQDVATIAASKLVVSPNEGVA